MSTHLTADHDLSNLAAAVYTVVLRAEDGRLGTGLFELEAGDRLEEEISLEPGGSVNLRYAGSVEYGQVELIQRGQTVAKTTLRSGTSETFTGFGGTAVVRIHSPKNTPDDEAFEIEREIKIKVGETIQVEMKAP